MQPCYHILVETWRLLLGYSIQATEYAIDKILVCILLQCQVYSHAACTSAHMPVWVILGLNLSNPLDRACLNSQIILESRYCGWP